MEYEFSNMLEEVFRLVEPQGGAVPLVGSMQVWLPVAHDYHVWICMRCGSVRIT